MTAADPRDGLLFAIRALLSNCPLECLGSDTDSSGQPYPIRDEVIDRITKALAHARPEAVDEWKSAYRAFKGAFDTPASRLRQADEFSEDARKRLSAFNDLMTLTPERAP